jgi:cell division protease FtsH
MVTHWGMSDRLGPMSFRIGEEHVFLGKEIQEPRDFAESTMGLIDEEVQKLLREADERAYQLLSDHRTDLDRVVEALLEREEIYKEDLERILGRKARPPHSEGIMLVGNSTPSHVVPTAPPAGD